MADFPALPLFTDAWIADTKHLSRAERGLYLDLLILMWRTPTCSLPNDFTWLERKLPVYHHEELSVLKSLVFEFCHCLCHSHAGGICDNYNCRIYQKRLHKEFLYLSRITKRNSENAKSRWNKEKISCETDANSHRFGNAPHPTPPLLERKKDSPHQVPPAKADDETTEFAKFWAAYPHKVGKGQARLAFGRASNKTNLTAMLEGIDRYKVAKPADVNWCHPATWLNGERWLDEPAKPNGRENGSAGRHTPTESLYAGAALALAKRERARNSGTDNDAPQSLLDRERTDGIPKPTNR